MPDISSVRSAHLRRVYQQTQTSGAQTVPVSCERIQHTAGPVQPAAAASCRQSARQQCSESQAPETDNLYRVDAVHRAQRREDTCSAGRERWPIHKWRFSRFAFLSGGQLQVDGDGVSVMMRADSKHSQVSMTSVHLLAPAFYHSFTWLPTDSARRPRTALHHWDRTLCRRG
jgi:hypothetical protein